MDVRCTKTAIEHVFCYGSIITKKENIRHFVVISCNSTFISTFNLSTTSDELNISNVLLRHLVLAKNFS